MTERHVRWGSSLSSLFDADVPGLQVTEVIAYPANVRTTASVRVTVSGTVAEMAHMVWFQNYIKTDSPALDLESLRMEQGEASFDFVAILEVRQEIDTQ